MTITRIKPISGSCPCHFEQCDGSAYDIGTVTQTLADRNFSSSISQCFLPKFFSTTGYPISRAPRSSKYAVQWRGWRVWFSPKLKLLRFRCWGWCTEEEGRGRKGRKKTTRDRMHGEGKKMRLFQKTTGSIGKFLIDPVSDLSTRFNIARGEDLCFCPVAVS